MILGLVWVLLVGAGVYVRFVDQPARMKAILQSEQEVRWGTDAANDLLREAVLSEEMASAARQRWSVGYRSIPDTLSSPDVVRRLNALSPGGFENFDITYAGIHQFGDYQSVRYTVKGRGYYSSLYRFVWHVENDPQLYRITGLELDHIDLITPDRKLGTERLKVMVSFAVTVDAYFGGPSLPVDEGAAPVRLAAALFPDRNPAANPFYPVVMQQLPPNTYGHVDVESARLVAVVGNEAIFADADGERSVSVGGAVYLGHILSVDPEGGRVLARLNKGGIIDHVELKLAADLTRTAAAPAAGATQITDNAK